MKRICKEILGHRTNCPSESAGACKASDIVRGSRERPVIAMLAVKTNTLPPAHESVAPEPRHFRRLDRRTSPHLLIREGQDGVELQNGQPV